MDTRINLVAAYIDNSYTIFLLNLDALKGALATASTLKLYLSPLDCVSTLLNYTKLIMYYSWHPVYTTLQENINAMA